MGGLAARVAGERYLGLKIDRGVHAEELKALGGLKGPLMKIAQILSTIPDAIPKEYADELAHLQANAPSMGWLFVKRRMASELGRDWQQRFGSFEAGGHISRVIGAAVHRARRSKASRSPPKYPDMQSAVQAIEAVEADLLDL